MQDLLIATAGDTTATVANAVAKIGLGKSIGVVTKALWGQFTAWIATGGWIIAIPAAIYLAVKAFDWLTVSISEAQETLSNSIQKYEETKQKISELSSELETVSKRMDELNGKETLTFAEEEEFTRLKLISEELKLQLELQRELEKNKAKEASDDAIKSIYAKQFVRGSTLNRATRAEIVQGNRSLYDMYESEIQDVLNGSGSAEQKSRRIEQLKISQNNLKTETLELINALVEESKSLDQTTPKAKALYDEVMSLANGTQWWISNLKQGNDVIGDAQTETDTMRTAVFSLETALASLPEKLKSIEEIQSKVNDGYSFSYDEIQKIKKEYPQLESAIYRTADGWGIEKTAIDQLKVSQSDLSSVMSTAQSAMTDILNGEVAKRLQLMGIELNGIKSLADAYAALGSEMRQQTDLGVPHMSLEQVDPEGYKTLMAYGQAQDAITKAQKELNDLLGGKVSGGSPSSSSGSGSRDKSSDPLSADVDRYEQFTTAINEADNAIRRLQSDEDDLYNAEKIDNLKEQISKTKELAQAHNDLAWEKKQERSELRGRLEGYGLSFTGEFDSTNVATNYKSVLDSMYARYNAMPEKSDSQKDAKANYLNQDIKLVENGYGKILAINNDVYDSLDKQATALKNANKYQREISDYYDSLYDERLSDSKSYIEDKKFYDNWGSDNEIAAWERVKQYTEQYYADGILSRKKYVEALAEINKSIYSAQEEWLDKQYSSALDLIEEETDRIKSLRDAEEKHWDNRISKLKESNEEQERAIKLAELQERLANQMNERNKRVWNEDSKEWKYVADEEAIADTRKEIAAFKQEQQIIDLENQRDKELSKWDKQIKDIERVQKEWERIAERIKDNERNLILESAFGSAWKTDILKNYSALEDYVTNWDSVHGVVPKAGTGNIGSSLNMDDYVIMPRDTNTISLAEKFLNGIANFTGLIKTSHLSSVNEISQNTVGVPQFNANKEQIVSKDIIIQGDLAFPNVQNPKQFVSELRQMTKVATSTR